MSIQTLLNNISKINAFYLDKEKKSGANFNIFETINLGKNELFHSKIISFLLNPKKSHNKGTLFIEKFLHIVNINDFPLNNIKVEIEKYIGNIDKKYSSGGRIDIVISDRKTGRKIIIENKIEAKDQYKQLQRYSNYDKNANIIYLTLFGNDASSNSVGINKDIKYLRISYDFHILKWINECISISVDIPIVKESLIQYKKLIEKITLQTRSVEMSEAIIKQIINKKDNIKSAIIIANNVYDLKRKLIQKYLTPELNMIAKKYGLFLKFSEKDIGEQYWGWDLNKKNWTSLTIRFEFGYEDFDDLYFGFVLKKSSKSLDNYIRKIAPHKNKKWPFWDWDEEFAYWDEEIFSLFINKNNDLFIFIDDKIKELLKIVKDRKDL